MVQPRHLDHAPIAILVSLIHMQRHVFARAMVAEDRTEKVIVLIQT
jgi:hypothetical protein